MKQCKCGAPLALTQQPPLLGQSHEVRVRLEGLPCLACPQGHTRRLPDKAFGNNIQTMLYGRVLPVAEIRGAIRRTHRCPRCGQVLDRAGRLTGEVLGQIALPGYPSFVIKVTAPLIACPGCGLKLVMRDLVLGDTVAQINHALANALTSNGIEMP